MICHWYPEPAYLIFASDLPELLYYSHIPAIIISLSVGLFVFINARHLLLNKLLLLISICFSLWTFINLIVWTNINSDIMMFFWSFFGVLQALISVLSIYFIHVFTTKEDAPLWIKGILLALITPVLLLSATDINVAGFNLDYCDAFDYEGVAFLTYYSFLGVVAMGWIALMLGGAYRKASDSFRKQILLMGVGIELFLFLFFTLVYLASYLAIEDYITDSTLEFYGLFGMTFFMVVLGVLIVKFRSFNIGAHVTNALVVGLLILVASQYTYTNSTNTTLILTTVTLVLTSITGILLILSVQKEIKQREEIENLAKKLTAANKRLKILDQLKSEFVSIASHQLRSPLTSIRGYASMLQEGSFGKLSTKAREAVDRIAESSRFMASSVEDYLNVSRIESGNMKYEVEDFNLRDMAEHIVDDMRQVAMKKGLLLTFKSTDLEKQGIVSADKGKVQQILHNLIDNSIKYTPKGKIDVIVRDNKKQKMIYVDITDTGIGMSEETIEHVFDKFERAYNANSVNVTGTGLGLYVARKMAADMGGCVRATSAGEGEGSTFTVEFPLKM